jgi:uroporphyrinogen decarboxylase
VLAKLNLSGCNFGPTLTVTDIRHGMPATVIHGQLDPMVFCRNDRREIVRQVLRDFEQARHTRGLVFQTAGVVNNGTKLTSMRLVMAAIQRYARYG